MHHCVTPVPPARTVTQPLPLFTFATYDPAMTAPQQPVDLLASIRHQARAEERNDFVAQLEREQELAQRLAEALTAQAN